MTKFIVPALVAATFATPALAQEEPVNAAGTGPRIEAIIGYDAPKDIENNILYGVGVGFDFTLAGATGGIEAEYTDSESEECASDVFDVGDELCAGVGRDLYIGGRVGAAVGTSSFLYVKGGYTNQRVEASFDDGVSRETGNEDLDGFRVGAGAEFGVPTFGFGSSTFLKAEYRYSNYEQGFEKHQGVVGLGFRF